MILLCLLLSPAVPAQPELSREEVEASLQRLKADIQALQKSLQAARARFSAEQAQLREVDLALQDSALKLRDLHNLRLEQEQALGVLEAERAAYLQRLAARKEFLNEQIVSAYQLGRESRLKLLLNQDSPARLSRMLAYYEFFSHAQVEQIQELRTALETLDQIQAEIDGRLLDLNRTESELQAEHDTLQARRSERKQVLSGIAGQIDSEQARLEELTRDRADLEALLERLEGRLADIPSELGEYLSLNEQRGSLPLPVSGRIKHAFGQTRAGGMNWNGWLIEAAAGTEIKTVAYGRVAYADWLRGYGLLMIIDHGEGFMSLYGQNESLLFEVGDAFLHRLVGEVGGQQNHGFVLQHLTPLSD